MDKIDTLVISGGGPSGIAYLGVFKGLYEKKSYLVQLDFYLRFYSLYQIIILCGQK